MKKTLFILLTILFTVNIKAQHTEKFLELTKSLKAIDSSIVIKKYNNGKPKEITKYLKYEYGDYNYEILSGKYQMFDKNGRLFFEQEYDRFGNLLIQRQRNNYNQVYRLLKATKIDLKSSVSVRKLLNSNKSLLIETSEKEYSSLEKGGKLILWKEGKRLNGKKIGDWKTYDLCNNTFKVKYYSND